MHDATRHGVHCVVAAPQSTMATVPSWPPSRIHTPPVPGPTVLACVPTKGWAQQIPGTSRARFLDDQVGAEDRGLGNDPRRRSSANHAVPESARLLAALAGLAALPGLLAFLRFLGFLVLPGFLVVGVCRHLVALAGRG